MGTKGVLIVDDEIEIRKTLSDFLRARGYVPMTAATGQAALDWTRKETPGVALIDLGLGDMSGLEVMEKIKERSPATECIVLTGHASQESAVEAINLGAYSYLQKPYGMEQLLVTIRRAIEKREAEDALQASVTEYRSLFGHMLSGFAYHEIVVDEDNQPIDYVFLKVNDAFERLTGLKREDVIGKKVTEIIPGIRNSEPDLIAIYGQVALTGEATRFDLYFEPFDKWCSVSAYSPRKGYFVAVFEDTTERVRAEEAEREQREIAGALADTAAALNSTLDLNEVLERILDNVGRVVAHDGVNIMLIESGIARVVRCRGYYAEHGIEEAVLALCLPLTDVPNLREMAETGQPCVVSDTRAYLGWVEAPETRWVRSYAGAPIRREGRVIGFLNLDSATPGFFTPSHAERLQAFADQAAVAIQNARLYQELEEYSGILEQTVEDRTAELRHIKERVEAILANSPDAILLLKTDGAIRTGNLAFHEMFVYEFDEAYGQLAMTLAEQSHTSSLSEALQCVADGGGSARLEIVARRNDGTTFDADVALAPIEEEGVVTGLVCSLRDISALKEVERMKEAFVSNVSHELRTPITNIKLYLSLLEGAVPSKRPKYMSVLKGQTGQMERLVEDLLDISRIDVGRVKPTMGRVRLAELVETALSYHVPQAEAKNLKLRAEHDRSAPPALASRSLMLQVLTNLVVNAINYTPEDGEVMILTGQAEREGRRYATLTVRDTGIGISEDELPHVFERFYRGGQARQNGISGTGLGLAIVKEITDMHAGLIEIDSQVGVGTNVTVWVPSVKDRSRDERPPC